MLRISTTTLESYRKFINKKFDSDLKESEALNEYILQLQGKFEPSIYMNYGSAFHEIIESPKTNIIVDNNEVYFSNNDINFSNDCIMRSVNQVYGDLNINLVTNEYKATKIYNINEFEIELVAKVDLIYGNTVIENKTAWSNFGANGLRVFYDEYYNSLQWKIYLEIFEASKCKFNVFYLDNKTERIELNQIYSFEFDKSQYCTNEIYDYLESFTNFLKTHNLINYFIKG